MMQMHTGSPGSVELRRALGELKPWFNKVAWFSVLSSLLVLAPSWYMLEVYDRVVNSRSHMTLAMLTILVLTATSVALLTCFAMHEARTPDPILPIGLLTNRIIVGGIVLGVAVGSVLMGSTVFLSLYIQGVMGLSAMIAGIAVGASSVSWPLGSFSV